VVSVVSVVFVVFVVGLSGLSGYQLMWGQTDPMNILIIGVWDLWGSSPVKVEVIGSVC
jgi:hypothetical protein